MVVVPVVGVGGYVVMVTTDAMEEFQEQNTCTIREAEDLVIGARFVKRGRRNEDRRCLVAHTRVYKGQG